jgi:hypothetical protein
LEGGTTVFVYLLRPRTVPAAQFGVAVGAGAPEDRDHRLGGGDDDIRERSPAVHGDELDRHHQRGDSEEDDPDAARYPSCELKNRSESGCGRAYTIHHAAILWLWHVTAWVIVTTPFGCIRDD